MKYSDVLTLIHKRLINQKTYHIAGVELSRSSDRGQMSVLPPDLLHFKEQCQSICTSNKVNFEEAITQLLSTDRYKNPVRLFRLLNLAIASFERIPLPENTTGSDHELLIRFCLSANLILLNKVQRTSLTIYAEQSPLKAAFAHANTICFIREIKKYWRPGDEKVNEQAFAKLPSIDQFQLIAEAISNSSNFSKFFGMRSQSLYEKILHSISLCKFTAEQRNELAVLMKIYSPKSLTKTFFSNHEIDYANQHAHARLIKITGIEIPTVIKELKLLLSKQKYEQAHYLIYKAVTNGYAFGLLRYDTSQNMRFRLIKNCFAQLNSNSVDKAALCTTLLDNAEQVLKAQEQYYLTEGLSHTLKTKHGDNLKEFLTDREAWSTPNPIDNLFDKTTDSSRLKYTSHGGGYFHMLEFLAGISAGYKSERAFSGLWVSPSDGFRNDYQVHQLDSFYANRATECGIDMPAVLMFKINPKYLEKTNRVDEAILTPELLSNAKDITVKPVDANQPSVCQRKGIVTLSPEAIKETQDDLYIGLKTPGN